MCTPTTKKTCFRNIDVLQVVFEIGTEACLATPTCRCTAVHGDRRWPLQVAARALALIAAVRPLPPSPPADPLFDATDLPKRKDMGKK